MKTQRLLALTSVKGIGAVLVVLYHFQPFFDALVPALRRFDFIVSEGATAVDFFFVVSGFSVCFGYANAFSKWTWSGYRRFLWGRLARLYPVHLMMIAVVGTMALISWHLNYELNWAGYSAVTLLQHLTLVHAWTPHLFLSWNFPSWSISALWLMYLVFPGVLWLQSHLRTRTHFVLYSLPLFALIVIQRLSDTELPFRDLFRVVFGFGMGALIYRWRALNFRGYWNPAFVWPLIAVAVGRTAFGVESRVFLPLLFPALLYWLVREGRAWGLLSAAPLVFLGEISYSIYMSHTLVLKFVMRVFPAERWVGWSVSGRVSLVLGVFAMTGVLGYAVWRWIERPFQRRLLVFLNRPAN